jgi:hypothetical protein
MIRSRIAVRAGRRFQAGPRLPDVVSQSPSPETVQRIFPGIYTSRTSRDARLRFEQEILVEIVIFRHADIVSRETADRLFGLAGKSLAEESLDALLFSRCTIAILLTISWRAHKPPHHSAYAKEVHRVRHEEDKCPS